MHRLFHENNRCIFNITMDYIKITFRIESDADYLNDIMMADLGEIGFESFEETSRGFNAFIPADIYDKANLLRFVNDFTNDNNCNIQYREETIADQNWNTIWEQNGFEPIFIDRQVAIYPTSAKSTIPSSEFKYNIELNPVQAFGSGYHDTTQMMMRFILSEDLYGKTVLDMGCGTAVLAILARMNGAQYVDAIDIDHWSTENAVQNVELNHLTDIQIVLGGANSIAELRRKYDCIFANINRNILLNDIEKYVAALKPDGKLFMSGFYSEDIFLLDKAANELGMQRTSTCESNNWVAAEYRFRV